MTSLDKLNQQLAQIYNGTHEFIAMDFNKAEQRVLAAMTQPKREPVVIENGDIHLKAAMAVFGLDECEITSHHRNFAKRRHFKYVYSPAGTMPELPPEPTNCHGCFSPLMKHPDENRNTCRHCLQGDSK